MSVSLKVTNRFEHAYFSAPNLRYRIHAVVWDLVQRYAGAAPLANRQIRKLEGLTSSVWRAKLDYKRRLLFSWDGDTLLLIDAGSHELSDDYSETQYRRDRASSDSPSHRLSHLLSPTPHFFTSTPDETISVLANEELGAEWVYFLDEQQSEIQTTLEAAAISQEVNSTSTFHFIVGGPGTGKTSILLSLLDLLRHRPDLDICLRMQANVREYGAAGLGYDLRHFLRDDDGGAIPRLVLLDDPNDIADLRQIAESATLARHQMVVAAFDPLQLATSITDAEYEHFVKQYNVAEHRLTAAYRQKTNVGQAAKRAIDSVARSTPFLDESKIRSHHAEHSKLTRFANDVTFRNPHGYVRAYPDASRYDIEIQLDRLLSNSSLMWVHWPPLLVVLDDAFSPAVRETIIDTLYHVWPGTFPPPTVVTLSDPSSIKGAEYQHVFLCLRPHTFHEIEQGFKGSGRQTYNKRRLLRIPFTRAKDSLCTFISDTFVPPE